MAIFSTDLYKQQLQEITDFVGDRPLDKNLQDQLNAHFPPSGRVVLDIISATQRGIDTGTLCKYGAEDMRYGRVIKPCVELNNCSVDVVHMTDIAGPHHKHPKGEIDLIMPISADAKFDDHRAGWLVYEPGSAHKPTVTQGEAWVLYLLPGGEIEFTKP